MSQANLLVRLSSLFRGLSRAHGIYELLARKVGGKKVQGKARTVRGEVSDNLWKMHVEGAQGLGIVPIMDDNTCVFGAIDVDRYDLDLTEVEAKVAELGLPLLPTRTKSGGVHLYCFAKASVAAGLMKLRLEEWSVALGYGGAEVFPKQATLLSDKDVGNWINMPYFGSVGGITERYGIFKGQQLSLVEFLDRADAIRITEEQLESLVPPESDEFAEGPPCLQSLARTGFPEGMRNNGLFAVGVYLKQRYPDDWTQHLRVYNVRFFKPPLGESEVSGLVKTLNRKEYSYTCDKPPLKMFCNRNLCRTRDFGIGRGSDDWGVVIDTDVQRVSTDPPYWIVNVNGTRMMFFSEDLIQQRRFQTLCMEKIGILPPPLPPDKWRAEVNKILQSAVEIEAPSDSSVGGELEYHLKQFITVHPQAETRAEVLVGKPYTEDGLVYFRSADFRKYLEAQHFRALSGPRLYARLRQCGVGHKQFWVEDQNIQVWAAPAEQVSNLTIPATIIDKGAM
ncbi:hypothetical protein UFOVP820_17 [uncultured Caudovirales phage]|uniref:TOTE conflict system primase domain-containing protein n=1 Tax=uncultured Caudovirales phage TaxID=2100421 RepID=A0A6J5P015_9CAUD|nr:hypothetical protein UFOVP820_17 [uncultured Caudovirales phage]